DLYLRKKGGEAREEGPVRGRPVVVEKTCSCEQHGAVAHRAHQLRARGLLLEEIEIGALRIVDDLHQSGRLPARHPIALYAGAGARHRQKTWRPGTEILYCESASFLALMRRPRRRSL